MGSKVREQDGLCPLLCYTYYGTENVPFHFMHYNFQFWIHPYFLLQMHV